MLDLSWIKVIPCANNEMLILRFHALGNKTQWIGHSPDDPWWYLANVGLLMNFEQSTLLVLPRVTENSKANMQCKKGFYRPITLIYRKPIIILWGFYTS